MGNVDGKRVVVMGLGRFGGGIGVARWLCAQKARVHVTDLADAEHLASSVDALRGMPVTFRLGGHDLSDLTGCDLLVVSPAVDKAKSDFFKAAAARSIPWTSEMNLFLERCRGKIVGITGSVGKSTTTAMIGAILEAAAVAQLKDRPGRTPSAVIHEGPSSPPWRHGKVWLGGNIGKSLLDELPRIQANDIVVLELSSFQLEDAAAIRKSPHIAVVTNLTENHLDRHGTMQAYAAAKSNIYKFQSADDSVVMPHGLGIDLLPADWKGRTNLVRFGIDPEARQTLVQMPCGEQVRIDVSLAIPGLHNLQNAAAALAVSRTLGVGNPGAVDALAKFKGLAHRLEFVREIGGVKYYNDSKATTPEAAMTSIRAFDGGVVALVGGSDKGSSFVEFGRLLAQRAKAVICMGDTREKIHREIAAACSSHKPAIEMADDFEKAVEAARDWARPGDTILLSPGCASYDWFANYEERGDTFKRLVHSAVRIDWSRPA